MARQRGSVPAQSGHGIALGDPRSQGRDEPVDARRGGARRRLEGRQLVRVVDDAQPIGGIDEQVARILDPPARPDQLPHRVDDVRRRLERGAVGVGLPADHADPRPGSDPLIGEDLPERPGPISGLAGQAQVLEQLTAHRQRRRTGHAVALVADEDRRNPVGPDDEQGLLEAGVEAGQPGEVRAVFPVGIHDARGRGGRPSARAGGEAGRVGGGREVWSPVGHAEVGESDRSEAGPPRRRASAAHGTRISGPVAPRSIRTVRSASIVIQGPSSPSGHVTRTSALVAGPSPTWVGPSWPLLWPPPMVTSRASVRSPIRISIQAPIASRFGPSWTTSMRDPVRPRRSIVGDVPPSCARARREPRGSPRRGRAGRRGRGPRAPPRAPGRSTTRPADAGRR